MIEKCNFKVTIPALRLENEDGSTELVREEYIACAKTNGMKCPGEMECIDYMCYYNFELYP